MELTQEWIINNIVDEKYLETLKKTYANHNLPELLLLNIDLRMLYLKHILMIENSLKYVLLHQLFINELQNYNNINAVTDQHWRKLKAGRKLIRAGYNKYGHNGILKNRTVRGLIEVMSFEWTMKVLESLNSESLTKVAHYFGIDGLNCHEILIEQLLYLKDVRNYLSHNFKVLTIHFTPKQQLHYQQELAAVNGHHYLHLIINNFSSKSGILMNFFQEYQQLFNKYGITINSNLMEQNYEQKNPKSS